MIFSKLLLINALQRLETQTLGHYWLITEGYRRHDEEAIPRSASSTSPSILTRRYEVARYA